MSLRVCKLTVNALEKENNDNNLILSYVYLTFSLRLYQCYENDIHIICLDGHVHDFISTFFYDLSIAIINTSINLYTDLILCDVNRRIHTMPLLVDIIIDYFFKLQKIVNIFVTLEDLFIDLIFLNNKIIAILLSKNTRSINKSYKVYIKILMFAKLFKDPIFERSF